MDAGKIRSSRRYNGRIINVDIDEVRFPNGTTGELEMVRHPGAAAVVPFVSDPFGDDPQILLLRQYRYAAGGYLYEIPAGKLDGDEDPRDCARRELKEETGCTAERVEPLVSLFTTPGFTDERIHLFMASGLTHGEAGHEAHEFIEVETVPFSRALSMVQAGEIPDGKTAFALLYVAGFRLGR